MPLKQLSRKVVFVNTAAKKDRVSLLKPINQIPDKDDDSEDIYQTSLIDMLPDQFSSTICALQSLLPSTPLAAVKNSVKMRTHALPLAEDEKSGRCESIKVHGGLGRMYKRKREAAIRCHLFNMEKEPSKVYRSKIMLYVPWRDESSDLLGGYLDFLNHCEDKI